MSKKKKDEPTNKEIRKYAKAQAKEKRGDNKKSLINIKSKAGYSFSVDKSKIQRPVSRKFRDLERRVNKWYEVMGKIDWDFDYFSIFTPATMHDIRMIFDADLSCHERANTLNELLEPQGFIELGTGTNIITYVHSDAPGVVYKIALDAGGLADNRNDPMMAKIAPEARPPIVVDVTKDGLISVQEYVFGIKNGEDMSLYLNDALEICRKLSKRFLVIDVTPRLYTNWAIGRNMELRTCDVSDLYPLDKGEDVMRCPTVVGENKKGELTRCNGRVYYDDYYQRCYCSRCGRNFLPIELKPRAKQWDLDELISTGLTDIETNYTVRRADHFKYYKNRAAERGLVATYVSTALLTPLPDTYPTRKMNEEELRKFERKTGKKIVTYAGDQPFKVDYPEYCEDFSDNFYRKHGQIPGRIDEGDFIDLERLIRLNPELAEKRKVIIIGNERICTSNYVSESTRADMSHKSSEPEWENMSEAASESADDTISCTLNEPCNDTFRKYDSDGFMIGSKERKEHYRNLEVEPPLFDMVNGKKVFRSKDAQIIWCRGNVNPASFAQTVQERYNGDIDRMVETFERYYPDSRLDYYMSVTIPSCYLFGEEAENVESIPDEKDENGFTKLKSASGSEDIKERMINLYKGLRHAPKERTFADDAEENPAITTIPLDDVPANGSAKLSPQFGTDIERVSKTKQTDIRMSVKDDSDLPSWATAAEAPKAQNDEIEVQEVVAETEEVEMMMTDGQTLALEFDMANVHNLDRFLKEKLPKITISMDGGNTVAMTISSSAMGKLLSPLIAEVVKLNVES